MAEKTVVQTLYEFVYKGAADARRSAQDIERMEKAAKEADDGLSRLDVTMGNFYSDTLAGVRDGLQDAARAAIEFGIAGIDLFVDLQETNGLLRDQLGPSLENYESQLSSLADETQRSENRLKDLGSVFVTLTTNTGFAVEQAAEISTLATSISLDLSSAFNLETADAVEKLRAAYVGSSEPLQAIGIDTREAALQQAAFTAGIIESLRPLTAQERILAVNAAVQEQAAAAMGNAAKTAGVGANAARELEDAYYDLQLEIGENLLSVQEDLIESQLQLIEAYGDDAVNAVGRFGQILDDQKVIYVEFNRVISDFRKNNPTLADFFLGAEGSAGNFTSSLEFSSAARLAATISATDDTAEAVNQYYIALGQAALAEEGLADVVVDRTAQQEALASALDAVAQKQEVVARGGARDTLQGTFNAQQQASRNIETTTALLNQQEQARLDRNIAITQSYIDQQRELGALVDLNSDILDTSAEQAFFDIGLESGAAIGNLLGYAEAGGIVSDENRELIADSALLEQKLIDLNTAVEAGEISRDTAIQQYEDFRQSLIDNTDNAGDLITEIDNLNTRMAEFEIDRTSVLTLDIQGIELLREAAALRAGLTGTQQLVNQVGNAEASNILERQLGAPAAPAAIPSTTEASARGIIR